MDSRPIEEVYEAYRINRLNIKNRHLRDMLDGYSKTIYKYIGRIGDTPVQSDRAWRLLEQARYKFDILPGKYETEEEFYEAIFGFELGNAKEHYDYCGTYFEKNRPWSSSESSEFKGLLNRFPNSMSARYQMKELRREWENAEQTSTD